MTVRSELQDIYDNNGSLTAELVLERAKDPDTSLHTRFPWDNDLAAHKYRLDIARKIIRSIKITYKEASETNPPSRINQYLMVRREGSHAYENVEDVATDPIAIELVMRQAQREWLALRRRYGHMSEFFQMILQDVLDFQKEQQKKKKAG